MFRRQQLLTHLGRAAVDAQCADALEIRRGFYVPADSSPAVRYASECRAVLERAGRTAVLAGPSAALWWGLPVMAVPHAVVLRGVTRSGHRRRVQVLGGEAPSVEKDELLVTPPALTVVDSARLLGARDGLIVADAALHSGLCTLQELRHVLDALGRVKGVGRARWVVAEADPLAESPGETWTRMVLRDLGYDPVSQYRLQGEGFVAYVDLMLEERLGIEFDGAVKYRNPGVLFREKVRHSQAEECGTLLMRVLWQQLEDPARIDLRIRSYGLRPVNPPRGRTSHP